MSRIAESRASDAIVQLRCRVAVCASSVVFVVLFAVTGSARPETPPFNPVGEQAILVVPLLETMAPGYDPAKCGGNSATYVTKPRLTAGNLTTLFNFSTDFAFFYKKNSYSLTQWDATVLTNPARKDGWWPAPPGHTVNFYCAQSPFNGRSSQFDDALQILQTAVTNTLLTQKQADTFHRLVIVLNKDSHSGGTAGPIDYNVFGATRQFKVTYLAESNSNEDFLLVARHELGHQLGLSAHYYFPCPRFP